MSAWCLLPGKPGFFADREKTGILIRLMDDENVVVHEKYLIIINQSNPDSSTDPTTRIKHLISHLTSGLDKNLDVHKNHRMNANEFDGYSNIDLNTHTKPVISRVARIRIRIRALLAKRIQIRIRKN